jgi:histidinol-phosphate aminotransferase
VSVPEGQPPLRLDLIRDDVRALRAYPVPASDGLIKLDAMENPYRLPPPLAQALGERLSQVALNRYPPGDPASLKQRLRASIGLPEGLALMLGNGSDELIHLVIQACARPGAVVLSPWPSFVMYQMSARFDGCRFADVPLRPDFGLDPQSVLAALREHQPALVFLAYPNNPTGNLFDRSSVEAVLDAAPGLVVVDEAYLPFAQQTWLPALSGRPNLLVLRTLSKLGLAGIRLGYLCGQPAWIEQFDKVRPPYNVGVLTLATAEFMLDHVDVLEAQAAAVRSERGRLLASLRQLPALQAFDSAANFVLFRVADADAVYANLLRRRILIKNVSSAHPLLKGCLRVTVGTPTENDAFVDALRASL